MRKDVRIGLSIGGVLLAVLIVYLLVPKETNSNRGNGQVVQSNTGGTTGQGGPSNASGPSTSGTPSDAGQTQPNSGGIPNEPSPAPRTPDSLAGAGGSTSGGGATSTAGEASAGEGGGQADASSGYNWGKLLNDGVMPESLIATKKDPFAEEPKVNGSQARNTPAGPIDWNAPANGGAGTPPAGNSDSPASPGAVANTNPGVTRPSSPAPTAPAPTAPAPAATARGEHVVQRGETFSSIALAVYGDARHWKDIQKANPTVDDTRLRPGMTIKLPDAASLKAQSSQSARAVPAGATVKAEPAIDPSKEYKVQPGDNLQKIALKLYGKATRSEAIHDANREKIPDEHKLRVGTILKLPEPPTHSPTVAR